MSGARQRERPTCGRRTRPALAVMYARELESSCIEHYSLAMRGHTPGMEDDRGPSTCTETAGATSESQPVSPGGQARWAGEMHELQASGALGARAPVL